MTVVMMRQMSLVVTSNTTYSIFVIGYRLLFVILCYTNVVDSCVHALKLGKASGIDDIDVEHIKYAHPIVISILSSIFNFCIQRAYVPAPFGM